MQVLKFPLHPGMNTILQRGTLKLRYLDYQESKLMGWFAHTETSESATEYEVYIALTGERVPDNYQYITSVQLNTGGGYFVVHAFD